MFYFLFKCKTSVDLNVFCYKDSKTGIKHLVVIHIYSITTQLCNLFFVCHLWEMKAEPAAYTETDILLHIVRFAKY